MPARGTRDAGGRTPRKINLMGDCRFNCRERALLPWLLAGGLLIALFLGMCGKAPAAAQQQPAAAAPAAKAAPESSMPQPVAAVPAFDVAAIHLHKPEPHEHNSIWSSPTDGHFKATNISVLGLIRWAYEMPETRILGAPGWAGDTYFNIEAEADPAVDQQLHNLTSQAGRALKERMVQALLADRFKLAAHTETRDLPIYALVAVKGGARLGESKFEGSTVSHNTTAREGQIEVESSNSLATLAEELSKEVGRPVVDRTGIAGRYDLKLKWTLDDAPASQSQNGSSADSAPSLFTALQEQLGLRLEPGKGPVQVLIIDHVEMPSEN